MQYVVESEFIGCYTDDGLPVWRIDPQFLTPKAAEFLREYCEKEEVRELHHLLDIVLQEADSSWPEADLQMYFSSFALHVETDKYPFGLERRWFVQMAAGRAAVQYCDSKED